MLLFRLKPSVFSLLALLFGAAVSEAVSFRKLRHAQIRLAEVTRPSVCHARQRQSIRKATKEFDASCNPSLVETKPSCDALRIRLQVAKRHRCPSLPPNHTVEAAVKALEHEANAHSRHHHLLPPFKTFVLEPAGVVPHVTAVFLHGAGQGEENAKVIIGLFQTAIMSGAIPPARILLPIAFNRSLVPVLNGTGPLWSTLDNSQMETAAMNVSRLQDVEARLFGTDRWLAGVFGYSQGSFLALAVSLRTRVSAVAALAGGLRNVSIPDKATRSISDDAHTVLVIGDEDGGLEDAKRSFDVLRRLSRKPRLVVLEGEGHGLNVKIDEALEETFATLKKGMFPGWVGRNIAPPSLVWEWNL